LKFCAGGSPLPTEQVEAKTGTVVIAIITTTPSISNSNSGGMVLE